MRDRDRDRDRDPMDPESSDSDVSVGGGDEYRFASPLTAPIPLPPPASKHALESPEAVQARLDELQRVEEHNIKKYDLLKAKRARKDDKIRQKRDIQDKKWAAILDARQRRDARIDARRKREDAAFSQFDHELEDEESNLRRRLKRLKRGLPPDESPGPAGRSISSASMSPPGPGLSTLPPPPKRHQVGPPGQPDAVNPAHSRPSPQSSMAAPVKSTLPAPSYSFYRDSTSSSYSRPYHHSSSYSTTPNAGSPPVASNGLAHSAQPANDRPPLGHLGRPASPLARAVPSTQSPVASAVSANPPRQTSSSYDTRPPPTTSATGFAPINPPPASGFATINPRSTATPPGAHVSLSRPLNDHDVNKTPTHQMNNGIDTNRFHSYTSTPNSASAVPTATTTAKRTPSTTHPYQMSEAFANRHHHCERVDSLNRGIWTSYGIGGTRDNPTGPAVEMYLRCNHDGCSRIDWRTVHGLQCHIVKNHDQPKGTIGSLDKALEKYGVPVKEVEDHERDHGRGTAGTMADPKNLKMKLKTKIQDYVRKSTPGPYGADPQATAAGYRPNQHSPSDSPAVSDQIKRSPGLGMTNGTFDANSTPQTAGVSPATTFPSAQHAWMTSSTPAQTPSKPEPEQKRLQGDFGVSEAAANEKLPQNGLSNGTSAAGPSPTTVNVAPPPPPEPSTHAPPEAPKGAPSQNGTVPSAAPEAPVNVQPPPQAQPSDANHKVEDKLDTAPPAIAAENRPAAPDGDVQMTGMSEETEEKKDDVKVNGQVAPEEKVESEAHGPTEGSSEDSQTATGVDGEAGARKPPQSPSMTAKTLPATTPNSARRPSRRSSVARKSVDGDAEGGPEDDRDGKEEKPERDARYEPRRSLTGRILRRGRF